MSVPLLLGRDKNGGITFELPVCDNMQRVALAASTASSVTVPVGKTRALFTYSNSGDVWVDYKNTATIPVGTTFGSTTAELRPILRGGLVAGQTLSFICPTTAYVHVAFWD